MNKLEEREIRRKASIVGSIIEEPAVPETGSNGRGRPKENRELKKRISLTVLPSLYADIQKIAYVQRRSISELVSECLEQYRAEYEKELEEYKELKGLKTEKIRKSNL